MSHQIWAYINNITLNDDNANTIDDDLLPDR